MIEHDALRPLATPASRGVRWDPAMVRCQEVRLVLVTSLLKDTHPGRHLQGKASIRIQARFSVSFHRPGTGH
jgi:hypothetical protein